jgi:hypothetical protein
MPLVSDIKYVWVENEGKQSDLKIKMPLVSDIKYVWVFNRVSDIVLSNLRVI